MKQFFNNVLSQVFSVPNFVELQAVAIEIGYGSIKYLRGEYSHAGFVPIEYDEFKLSDGIIIDGRVDKYNEFVRVLKFIKKTHNDKFIFLSIPSQNVYLYSDTFNGELSDKEIRDRVTYSFNEHIPLDLRNTVYDFSVISKKYGKTVVSISAIDESIVKLYEDAFTEAGFVIRSIEAPPQAIVRSVTTEYIGRGVIMIINANESVWNIIIVKNRYPIFNKSVFISDDNNIQMAIDECKKQYTHWDTRTDENNNRYDRISSVFVCGNLNKSIEDPLAKALGKELFNVNIWQNLFDINEYIPDFDFDKSQDMAVVAGLLIRNKM